MKKIAVTGTPSFQVIAGADHTIISFELEQQNDKWALKILNSVDYEALFLNSNPTFVMIVVGDKFNYISLQVRNLNDNPTTISSGPCIMKVK